MFQQPLRHLAETAPLVAAIADERDGLEDRPCARIVKSGGIERGLFEWGAVFRNLGKGPGQERTYRKGARQDEDQEEEDIHLVLPPRPSAGARKILEFNKMFQSAAAAAIAGAKMIRNGTAALVVGMGSGWMATCRRKR